jgi:hypothetical protein
MTLFANMMMGSGAAAAAAYSSTRSLRFNSADSAYLSRTPGGAGNQTVWTLSFWCKLATLGTNRYVFSAGTASTAYTAVWFDTNNKLNVQRVISSATDAQKVTTQAFRDTTAWGHFVVKMDAANTNLDIYYNGTEITAFDTNDEPTNINGDVCGAVLHEIGRRSYTPTSTYFDGYLDDVCLIDGQALTPSSFGETDSTTGQWVPKSLSGLTPGTTGFWLDFEDYTSTTTIGYDALGSNDWTATNFSVAAGSGNDSLADTNTNNYCTWNDLDKQANGSTSDGLLKHTATALSSIRGTFGVSSGKWYWEVLSGLTPAIGIATPTSTLAPGSYNLGGDAYSWVYTGFDGNKINNNSSSAYGSSFTTNDVIGVALDMDNGKVFFSKNGTWQNSGDPAGGTGAAFSGLTGTIMPAIGENGTSSYLNCGQRAFAYTPPTGFVALCTANLTSDTITASGTFTGNAAADGPFIWANGDGSSLTINSNAVTFGTHADKVAGGFKVRTSSTSYNTAGSNTWAWTGGTSFRKNRAKAN